MMEEFKIIDYEEEYKIMLLTFLEKCLPESGRKLDIEGRHSFYKDIKSNFEYFKCLLRNNEIIGTVALRKMNNKNCELKSLYLLERYHGRGYGRHLLEMTIAHAKKCGYEKLFLDSMSTSERAVRLYRKIGFVDTERYNHNEHSDIFMVLEL